MCAKTKETTKAFRERTIGGGLTAFYSRKKNYVTMYVILCAYRPAHAFSSWHCLLRRSSAVLWEWLADTRCQKEPLDASGAPHYRAVQWAFAVAGPFFDEGTTHGATAYPWRRPASPFWGWGTNAIMAE